MLNERYDLKTSISWKYCLFIAIAVTVLRALAVVVSGHFNEKDFLNIDAESYLGPARSLYYAGRFYENEQVHVPMFVRTPGYPSYITGVWKLTGIKLESLVLSQMLVSGFTAAMAYILGSFAFGNTCGLLSATLFAFEPLQFVASSSVGTESTAGFLYTASAVVAAKLVTSKRGSMVRVMLYAAILASATFVRPSTYYLPIVLVPVLLVVLSRQVGRRRAVALSLVFCMVFAMPLVAWKIRNKHLVGSWSFSGIEAINTYYYRAGGVLAHQEEKGFRVVLEKLRNNRPHPTQQPVGPDYDAMLKEGRAILLGNIPETLLGMAKGMVSLMLGVRYPTISYFHIPRNAFSVALLQFGWLTALCVCVIAIVKEFLSGKNLELHFMLLTLPLYVVIISSGPEANPRFRVPIMGVLCVYVARGIILSLSRLATVTGQFNSLRKQN